MISRLFSFGSMISFGVHSILIGILWFSLSKIPEERPFLIHVVWDTSSVPKSLSEKQKLDYFSKQSFEKKTLLKRRQVSLYPARDKLTKNQHPFIQREDKKTLANEKGEIKNRKTGNQIIQSFLKSSQSFSRQDYHPLPAYPWVCRKNGEEGEVGIVVKVNEEGQVIYAGLFKSSGYKRLDAIALSSVKSWVYARGGHQERVLLVFRLSREPQVRYMANLP